MAEIFRAIGLMSGSSMDGIDAAILETDGKAKSKHVAGYFIDYSTAFHLVLRAAEYAVQQELGDVNAAECSFQRHALRYVQDKGIDVSILRAELEEFTLAAVIKKLTMLHYEAVEAVLIKAGLESGSIDVIGFHGQNLYHNPKEGITLQVGDGQLLANLTGIAVINNFRANDVKHGGQGAPFAPLYHQVLIAKNGVYPAAVVNCGGIANISLITGPNEGEVFGFDVGPGSVLIDRYVRMKTENKELMDENGKYGLRGKVNLDILKLLREQSIVNCGEDFLHKLPPKSLDASNFILIEELDLLGIEDACATLEVFAAECIAQSINLVPMIVPKLWVLAGGGWNNPVVISALKECLTARINGVEIYLADDLGWSSKYLEAELFAYMAVRSLNGAAISFPSITNVSEAISGGDLYAPQIQL